MCLPSAWNSCIVKGFLYLSKLKLLYLRTFKIIKNWHQLLVIQLHLLLGNLRNRVTIFPWKLWGKEKLTCSRELFITLSLTYANLAQTQKIVSDLIDEANGFHTITKFLLNCLHFLDILHHHIHISILFKIFNQSEIRTK